MSAELSVAPIVRADGARVLTNSRDVAAYFRKEHGHVLRDIDALIARAPEAASKFGLGSYLDENNQERRCFDMDRDGFTLLAMGFTGPRALQFKLAYIAAFNAMEAEIKRSVPATHDDLMGAVREIVRPIAVRFDDQDRAIARVERKVNQLGEQVNVVTLELYNRRRNISGKSKSDIVDAIKQLGGKCPCGCGQDILANGILVSGAEWDHFYGRNRSSVNEIWVLRRECHSDLSSGRVPRDQREPQFRAFHDSRRRLPERMLSLF